MAVKHTLEEDGGSTSTPTPPQTAALQPADTPDCHTPSPNCRDAGREASVPTNDEGAALGSPGKFTQRKKINVAHACGNCKKAHLACDHSRPCKRCIALGKAHTCIDVPHKKRGRPKSKGKRSALPSPSSSINNSPARCHVYDRPYMLVTNGIMRSGTPYSPVASPSPVLSTSHLARPAVGPFRAKPPRSVLSLPSQDVAASASALYSMSGPSLATSPMSSASTMSPMVRTSEDSRTVTFIARMDAICTQVSSECSLVLGYAPHELHQMSLYQLVHRDDMHRLTFMRQSLFMQLGWNSMAPPPFAYPETPSPVPSSSFDVTSITRRISDPTSRQSLPTELERTLYTANVESLATRIPGTPEVVDSVHVRKRDGTYELQQARMYLGSGLGGDPRRPGTSDQMYLVCQFRKFHLAALLNTLPTPSPHTTTTSLLPSTAPPALPQFSHRLPAIV